MPEDLNFSKELEILLDSVEKQEKLVAMLAPSFPIDFEYPQIVGMLKRLGFSKVVEVSRGAMETNRQLLEALRNDPQARFITSPCPTIVRLIRSKYPQLVKYLSPTDSPMVATAKMVIKEFPGMKIFFIGPCLLKRLEATEDNPALGITAITFKDLQQAFDLKQIKAMPDDLMQSFDAIGRETRLYPISGGLSQSAGINDLLTDEEYDVVSGPELVVPALESFEANTKLRVLDILNCPGGCIAGPGINSTLTTDQRRLKVIAHWAKQVS